MVIELAVLATTVTVSALITGGLMGLARGIQGWATKREPGEGINYKKLGRTIVIFTAAGVVVALSGDPLTGGNIVQATTVTAILGVVFDDVYAALSRQRRQALQEDRSGEAAG